MALVSLRSDFACANDSILRVHDSILRLNHALGHKGVGLVTFLSKPGLEQGGFKDTTLKY